MLERTREAGKKILMSGGTRCNVLPAEVDLQQDFFTDSPSSCMRAIFASWGVWECWSWLCDSDHVGLALEFEEVSNKWFPASNSSKEVRNRLVAACEYAASCDHQFAADLHVVHCYLHACFSPKIACTRLAFHRFNTAYKLSCNMCRRVGVHFRYHASVNALHPHVDPEHAAAGHSEVQTQPWRIGVKDQDEVLADKVVLATGGLSFPAVGTDGTGHQIASKARHLSALLGFLSTSCDTT